MSNHTPGPWHAAVADEWRASSGEHAQWGRFDIYAGSNYPGAENYYRIASVSNANNSAQNQMNAKLIAAAPDMLQALRRAAMALAFASEDSLAMRDDYEAVSAAIRKATGEA